MSNQPIPLQMQTAAARRRIRWVYAGIILLLAAIAIGYFQFSGAIEGNFRAPLTMFAVMGMALLLTVWLLALSGFRARTRLTVFAVELCMIAGVVLLFKFALKMQGSLTGAGVPRFVWKWTPAPDAGLKPLATDSDVVVEKVDLATTTPQDFPEFLGPGRLNRISGAGLARDWSGASAPRQLWRQPIGLGWGSFAVVNGFAITQEQRGDKELVTCLEVKTGRIRWQHSDKTRFSEGMGGDGPRAAPTIVGGRVYVMGATGILQCLDGATGHPIWSRNILTDRGVANVIWGKSCSPLVYDDVVVVTGGEAPPSLMAFDRETGSPRWAAGADKSAYSSPAIATIAGRRQVMIVNAQSVTGHDAADGTVLWRYPWAGNWPKVSQAVAMPDDRVFISAGYGLGCAMLSLKAGPNQTMTLSKSWKGQHMKTEFTNVTFYGGFIYGLDDGVLACIDPATGDRRWRDGHYGHGQILGVDDLILVQAEEGDVTLALATPDGFQELGRFTALAAKTWNIPTLYGHTLLVRNDREAACYLLP